MATYHLRAKIVSRGKGQSAIAAAAYRSGKALTDERTGEVKDFSRRDHVAFEGIFAPAHAPDWARDRQQLWNRAEQAEKRKDAQLARELEISLPHELTDQQREWLVKDFVRENFVRRGFVVDVAIHNPGPKNDTRNFHAHLMVSMRQIEADGFAPTKDRTMNDRAQVVEWREKWAELANRHLERHGHDARIDHRSHEARGIEDEPTRYEGPKVTEMARRSQISDRRRENEDIRERNAGAAAERAAAAAEPRRLTLRERMEQRIEEDKERMRREVEAERQGKIRPDVWTERGGMVAQQQEAQSRTAAAKAQKAEKAKERRQHRAEQERREKAEAYFRDRLQPHPAQPHPSPAQRLERPSQDPARAFQQTAAQLIEQANGPQQRTGQGRQLPTVQAASPSPQPPQPRPPERGSEQQQREEARRSASSPETPAQRGAERERTERQVEREGKAQGKELTERQREFLRFYSRREEERERGGRDDGGRGRERD